MKKQQAMLLADFYKISHRVQYPEGTQFVYDTWTPRDSRDKSITSVVSFGQQKFIKEYLIEFFNENFFNKPKRVITEEYTRFIKYTLGDQNPSTAHIEALHDLGYLPLEIKSLPEGMNVPIRTPMITIQNTHPEFFWLTGYIETLFSCEMWKATTSATIAREYYTLLKSYANKTSSMPEFVQFQGHDFSMRGMSSVASSINSGMGHLLFFTGTDTMPAITAHEEFYNANIETELVGTSIPASEHSVCCANGMDEKATLIRFLTNIYPTGFVGFVSDTWDFWNLVGEILPSIKETIMNRDGKLVIRPDSGDPVNIICGDVDADNEWAKKGLIQSLYEIFGGTTNSKGYKELDSHIGAIYGDSITLERTKQICERLEQKGFASTNIVLGIGSYTYQYNTRDTFGFALKSTLVVINGDEQQIFKNPKTDNGIKKSQKGAVVVYRDNDGNITYRDGLSLLQASMFYSNMLTTIFKNGRLTKETSLADIRELARVYNMRGTNGK